MVVEPAVGLVERNAVIIAIFIGLVVVVCLIAATSLMDDPDLYDDELWEDVDLE